MRGNEEYTGVNSPSHAVSRRDTMQGLPPHAVAAAKILKLLMKSFEWLSYDEVFSFFFFFL